MKATYGDHLSDTGNQIANAVKTGLIHQAANDRASANVVVYDSYRIDGEDVAASIWEQFV